MFKKLLLFILLAIFPLMIFTPSFAQSKDDQRVVVVPREQTIDRDYFATGNVITISGTVNGDVFLAGGNVLVDGIINGDVIAAGGMVDFRGRARNIRVAGGQVNISGNVEGNATALGGSINLAEPGRVSGSLVAAGGSVSVFAPIGKGINAATGQLTLGNKVGGDVTTQVGQLTLTQTADINGNLIYYSADQAQIQSGARVGGQTTQNIPKDRDAAKAADAAARFSFVATLISFLGSLIVGLIILRLFPIGVSNITKTLTERPWNSLLVGFIALIATPIVLFLLFITVIGIPLALILLAMFLILLYISKIFVAVLIGQKIFGWLNWKAGTVWALILGLILYELLFLVPVLGWLAVFLVVLFGFGALLQERRNFYQSLREKKLT